MPKTGPIKKLKRYTHLPALLHLLQTRQLTVLSPSTWADQNDTSYLHRYMAARQDVKGLYVLCLTEAADTFHHWSIYAGGPSGVKIEFHPAKFQAWINTVEPRPLLKRVEYKRLDQIEEAARNGDSLPFLKRIAFRDEDEVRLLVVDLQNDSPAHYLPNFDLSAIQKISLSPWLPKALEESVRNAIVRASGESNEKWAARTVRRTSLLHNAAFVDAASQTFPLAQAKR